MGCATDILLIAQGINHDFASVDKGIHNKTTKYGLPTY